MLVTRPEAITMPGPRLSTRNPWAQTASDREVRRQCVNPDERQYSTCGNPTPEGGGGAGPHPSPLPPSRATIEATLQDKNDKHESQQPLRPSSSSSSSLTPPPSRKQGNVSNTRKAYRIAPVSTQTSGLGCELRQTSIFAGATLTWVRTRQTAQEAGSRQEV